MAKQTIKVKKSDLRSMVREILKEEKVEGFAEMNKAFNQENAGILKGFDKEAEKAIADFQKLVIDQNSLKRDFIATYKKTVEEKKKAAMEVYKAKYKALEDKIKEAEKKFNAALKKVDDLDVD